MSKTNLWQKLKSYLITGTFITVPFFIAFYTVLVVIRWIASGIGIGHGHGLFLNIFGLIITISLVIFIGAIAQYAFGNRFLDWLNKTISKIPLVGAIYSAARQIMEGLMLRKSVAFRKAVMIEYPRKGIYCLAFVTKGKHVSPIVPGSEPMIHLFLPTTPNPTSGFFLIVPEKDVIPLDISVQDAFRLIISGGVATSDTEKSKPGGII